jgi:hypothetical protein
MESGYVKFFDTREGKLFGFLVDEMNNELWFHHSDGRDLLLTVTGEVKPKQSSSLLPFPKKGDQLVFERGRNAKGPKAAQWGFKSAYDHLKLEWKKTQPAKQLPTRSHAGVFDIRMPSPSETHGLNPCSEAIGGYFSMGWYEHFQDAETGELYSVHCWDGVNGGKLAHSWADEEWLQQCYHALLSEFREAERTGAPLIRISRHERTIMLNFTQAILLESSERKADGPETRDGLEGGQVGRFHGIPVICDLTVDDHLPKRS